MSSGANGVPIATLKTIRYKKGVVGTNLLRLSKFGGPSHSLTDTVACKISNTFS